MDNHQVEKKKNWKYSSEKWFVAQCQKGVELAHKLEWMVFAYNSGSSPIIIIGRRGLMWREVIVPGLFWIWAWPFLKWLTVCPVSVVAESCMSTMDLLIRRAMPNILVWVWCFQCLRQQTSWVLSYFHVNFSKSSYFSKFQFLHLLRKERDRDRIYLSLIALPRDDYCYQLGMCLSLYKLASGVFIRLAK